jgi:alanine racemase
MTSKNHRPTWAEIDLSALGHNLGVIKCLLGERVKIMAVVKANAYGHGLSAVSRALVEGGIDYLGVATVDEAMKIREKGLNVAILVMGAVLKEEAEVCVKNNITLTLSDGELLEGLVDIAAKTNIRPKIHIKIDTGMGRIGVWHENALDLVKKAHSCREIDVEGIYTHFSSAARDKMFTKMQLSYFDKVKSDIERENIKIEYAHAANSVAVLDWDEAHFNLARPGILLYGVCPKRNMAGKIGLKPVMSLKTKIVYLKDVPPGRSISYGRTYITQKDTKIATIPIGYADGYGRILSNKAEALVRGKYVRVVGMVTMDQTLLDVGDVPGVQTGDEVVLIGEQLGKEIHIENIAKLSGTIPYEILSQITDRVPRVYMGVYGVKS